MSRYFEDASRLKLRLESNKGLLSVEDLWDLSLQSLDNLAKGVNKRLKDEGEESFIPAVNQPRKQSQNGLRLEILKHVINVKVAEQEAARTKGEQQAKLARLKDLLMRKEDEAFGQLSTDEITQQIGELEASASS